MANDTDNIDELLDTGKAARMALSMLKDMAPDIQRVKAIAEAIDRRTAKAERQSSGFVRVFIAFKKFIGDVKNINIEE